MLRLRRCILSRILSPASSPSSPLSSLHRLLSATASTISPTPAGFAVEDYLVATCGLTRPQARKASTKLSHLKSPSKPDAVLAFLAGLGLSDADVPALVAKDPRFLCAGVKRTLAPNVVELTGLGLSRPEIARLIPVALPYFRFRSISSKLQYYGPLFGSFENFLRALKPSGGYLLGPSIEKAVKPRVALLQECGLGACDIAKLYLRRPRLLSTSLERVRGMVACAEALGVPRGSGMFREALEAVSYHCSEVKIATRVEYLKKTFSWSDAEVGVAVSRAPSLLRKPKVMLQRRSEFLLSEVGLEPIYVAHRPAIINYSMDGRLRPRYYVLKFLKANGLVKHNRSYYSAITVNEKVFMERFICPHKEAAPRLAEDYAAACRGEVPTRFRFT